MTKTKTTNFQSGVKNDIELHHKFSCLLTNAAKQLLPRGQTGLVEIQEPTGVSAHPLVSRK